jgi:hypothetical protein
MNRGASIALGLVLVMVGCTTEESGINFNAGGNNASDGDFTGDLPFPDDFFDFFGAAFFLALRLAALRLGAAAGAEGAIMDIMSAII